MKQRLTDFALLSVGLASWLGAPLAAAESPQVSPPSTATFAAESLAHALADFARRTGLQLVYVSSDVNGVACKAVPDGLAARETLTRLLGCTGLSFEFINERTVRIFRQGTPAPAHRATSPPAETRADSLNDVSSTTTATYKAAQGDAVANGRGRVTIKKQGFLKWVAGVFTVCGPLISAGPAFCQTAEGTIASRADATQALEEVIVTAERRTTDIQKTAASVSVRTGEELAEQGRYTTRQILEDIPGIVAADGNADVQGNSITIRGITPGPSAAGGVSGISAAPGAAVYVDGVIEGIGSGYDIDRVEVLRGPQGTLYGRSASTGVVAFHTRNPSMDGFAGNASVEFGNYDLQHYSAAVNIPLADGLAARVSGDYYDQGEGYYGAATRGVGTRKNGRAKLLWEPNEGFSLLMGVAYEKRESFGGGTSYTATLPSFAITTTNSLLAPGFKETRQYWAEVNWDVGPVKITYLPAFRGWEQDDTSIITNMFLTGQNLRTATRTPKDNFLTHELRVASRDDSAVQWQAGVFYYRNTLANNVIAQFESPAGVPGAITTQSNDWKDTQNLGYFAETTIPLNDSLRVTLGARYDDTKVVVSEFLYANDYQLCGNNIGVTPPLPPGVTCTGVGTASVPSRPGVLISAPLKFQNFNYKARLEYDLTPKSMLYGVISTGFRPGDAGVNSMTHLPNILGTEQLTSIELGSKNRFLDDSLQVNVGVYYYDYHNDGFRTFYQPNIFFPGGFVNVNVPLHNFGGELELQYRLTANDRIGLNANYVESRWYDKPAGFHAAYPQTERAMTPYTVTANYAHEFHLPGGTTLSARIDGRYEAAHLGSDLQAQYLAIGHDQYVWLGGRTIGNLSAGWASADGRISISAYVRNFTNVQYTSYSVSTALTRLGVSWSDPRTYGAQASVRF
jgi:iron complex outermembrane receptor protein